MTAHLEVEQKYAATPATALPKLGKLAHVAAVSGPVIHQLSAVYFDTPDLRLLREKITLRRRVGGKDAGWHIKLPGSAGRLEFQAPLDQKDATQAQVPAEFRLLLAGIIRDLEVVPIAQVDNERHEWILNAQLDQPAVTEAADETHEDVYASASALVDADGDRQQVALAHRPVLAEFVDDHVTSWSLLPGGAKQQWREWELELGPDFVGTAAGSELLDSAANEFARCGATPADTPSKLVMALGKSKEAAPLPPQALTLGSQHPAASVFAAIAGNSAKIPELDLKVRLDSPDSIHQLRVASRELRSYLRIFHQLFTPGATDTLNDKLKELGRVLGTARDLEVLAELLANAKEPLAAQLSEKAHAEYRAAHGKAVEFMESPDYLELLGELEHFCACPPFVPEITDSLLVEGLAAAHQEIMQAYQNAVYSAHLSPDEREDTVHSVRKAVKKLRYCAEAVMTEGKLLSDCKAAQEVLGNFQDTVTVRNYIAQSAAAAYAEQQINTYDYGFLAAGYHQQVLSAMGEFPRFILKIDKSYAKLHQQWQRNLAKAEKDSDKFAEQEKKRARRIKKAAEAAAKQQEARKAARTRKIEEFAAQQAEVYAAMLAQMRERNRSSED